MPRLRRLSLNDRIFGPLAVSLALLAAAIAGQFWIAEPIGGARGPIVYCAAAVRPVVEPLLRRYEAETGVAASLRVGPSGALEAQIRLSGKGDLFLPAAADPFLQRLDADGVVRERLRVASMRLVLAFAPELEERPESLVALIASGLPYGVCNEQAAAGQKTKEAAAGLWPELQRGAAASLPTVTELAAAVRDGGRLRAGVVWSVTAEQFGLAYVEPPELAGARGGIEVGVLRTTTDRAAAQQLARFLSSNEVGRPAFQAAGYEAP